MSNDAPPSPGFFGKIPARGDFLARRVPPGLAGAWETWLQSLTVAAREAAADGWPETWLTAPLWHFVLGAEVAPPHGAAGVLVASADRVGRMFPFTLIGAADGSQHGTALSGWTQSAEGLILAALDDGFDPATLDAALVQLGPPPPVVGPDRIVGRWPAALDDEWPEREDPLADDAPMTPGPGQSVWWCRGSDRIAPVWLRCTGLPGPRTSAAMVVGGDEVTPE